MPMIRDILSLYRKTPQEEPQRRDPSPRMERHAIDVTCTELHNPHDASCLSCLLDERQLHALHVSSVLLLDRDFGYSPEGGCAKQGMYV